MNQYTYAYHLDFIRATLFIELYDRRSEFFAVPPPILRDEFRSAYPDHPAPHDPKALVTMLLTDLDDQLKRLRSAYMPSKPRARATFEQARVEEFRTNAEALIVRWEARFKPYIVRE